MELPGRCRGLLAQSPSPPRPRAPRTDTTRKGVGTSTWPPMGTSIWPSVGTYSWPPMGTFTWPRTAAVGFLPARATAVVRVGATVERNAAFPASQSASGHNGRLQLSVTPSNPFDRVFLPKFEGLNWEQPAR